MTTLKAILLSVILVPLAFLASARYAIVDVHEKGPDGVRLMIPVPLALAQFALYFVPDELTRVQVPELDEYLESAQSIVAELAAVENAELVRVTEGQDQITVAKRGKNIEVDAVGSETVRVRAPIETLEAILQACRGEHIEASQILSALRASPGALVHVNDGSTEVKVRLW
jgi:hypothetical protein